MILLALVAALQAPEPTFPPSPPIVADDPRTDPWDEGGVERAEQVIAQCLERAARTPPEDQKDCVHAAFLACEDEHGTSQRDLNDCAAFSRRAWEARLVAATSRLMSAKTIDPKFGRAEPTKKLFGESQRRWDEWSSADCDMQHEGSKGGSMHPYLVSMCLSNHSAHRALELDGLIWWWSKSFEMQE